uniref:Chitin-binding type-2 domain-containing protein n=1 Tax=Strigamia maritima TaxID=126957 RepID=T1J4L9_STRMM
MAYVWHFCKGGSKQETFLCPNGTIFNQKHLVCDWWYNVECEKSPYFFHLNSNLHEQLSLIKKEDKRNNNMRLPDITFTRRNTNN